MSPKRKYLTLSSIAALLFVYLFFAEVADRWTAMLQLYQSTLTLEQEIRSPEDLTFEKSELLLRKKSLLASATAASKTYNQTQTGMIEFLNQCAKQAGVRFESLTPLSSVSRGELSQLTCSLVFKDDFVSAGRLMAAVEAGAISCDLTKVHCKTLEPKRGNLEVTVEGTAYIFPKAEL
jgi:hypothetical protein